jgi:hypothetical protein
VAVGGVDHDHVNAGLGQQRALFGAGTDADGRADAQTAEAVLGGERVLGGLHHVLDGDEAGQAAFVVEHQHALEAVLVHQRAASSRLAPSLTVTRRDWGVMIADRAGRDWSRSGCRGW